MLLIDTFFAGTICQTAESKLEQEGMKTFGDRSQIHELRMDR